MRHSVRSEQKLIAIVGPTASGKTDFAIALAEHFKGVVISADSRQVYREMRVNTARPKGAWRTPSAFYRCFLGPEKRYIVRGIPHLLMDEVAPDEPFTLADYQKRVMGILKRLRKSGAPPAFLVGGTGLYVDAVTQGYVLPKYSAARRKRLERKPLHELLALLEKHDPETYRTIDTKNVRRVIRAVEASLSGVPFSRQRTKKQPPFDVLFLSMNPPRDVLERRLKARARAMFREGLLAETERLVRKYDFSLPALSAIGYRDAAKVLTGEMTEADAVARRVILDRQYAKRQMTWLKRNRNVYWNIPAQRAKTLVTEFLSPSET